VIEQVGDKLAAVHSIERKMDAGAPSVKSMMDLRKIVTGKNMLVSQDSNAQKLSIFSGDSAAFGGLQR